MRFGDYMKYKRENLGYTLAEASEALNISTSYLCDIEKNRRYAPLDRLEDIINLYEIKSEKEVHVFYDMAGESRNEVAPDIARVLKRDKDMRRMVRNLINSKQGKIKNI
jgi:transcriptional regulator with XRE-family HTH domain